jgi:hypothetical protein
MPDSITLEPPLNTAFIGPSVTPLVIGGGETWIPSIAPDWPFCAAGADSRTSASSWTWDRGIGIDAIAPLWSEEADMLTGLPQKLFSADFVAIWGTKNAVSEGMARPVSGATREKLLESALAESRLRRDLEDSVHFAQERGETAPSQAAIESCMRFARRLIPFLIGHTGLQMAGFDNENGEVSLVLQSSVTKRRLTFEFSADGARIVQWKTDEDLRVVRSQHAASEVVGVGEEACWLTGNR